MRLKATVEVKNNLKLTVRERGKIVARREGHNIWVDLGREYLAGLISLAAIGPDTPEILQVMAVAVKAGLLKSQLDEVVAVHPTMAEELVLLK